jgi:maltose O-acetyltransferase
MTEMQKMLAGGPYDCGDPELMDLWHTGKNLAREFNQLDYADTKGQQRILDALLGGRGKNTQITAPFFVDYGKFIFLGNNCEVNMNCVFLDCNRITLGDNVLIAPGVHIYTVFHPLRDEDRLNKTSGREFPFALGLTSPVTIGNNVWVGGGTIIMPGVSIGNNVTIGAGSTVTGNIPDNVLAVGSPCRVAKEL